MNRFPWVPTAAGLLLLALVLRPSLGQEPRRERIVFLGDSITDGHTYPLLIQQALAEAGRPVPICINAGSAGDTAQGMRKRLERDVLVHRPTLVTLSVGINDVLRNVKVADYEADVAAIAERLKTDKIPLLVLTTTILGDKHAAADKRLADFNAVLRRIAKQHRCRVAEVNEQMQEARKDGKKVLEPDEVHLTFAGYQVMTRAILDALGHKDVPVPKEGKYALLPGILPKWQVRAATDKETPLDEKAVLTLKPDDSWKTCSLPEKGPEAHWWFDQERQRGFAVALEKTVGQGKSYVGTAVLEVEKPANVFFNTGAQLQAIWLNGKRIYSSEGWTGWHAGKERVPASLQAGRNVIVIETGPAFFLSVTPTNDW